MRLTIADRQLDDEAAAWWRSLTPDERGVYLQATWECEGLPAPRTNAYRAAVAAGRDPDDRAAEELS